MFARDGKTTVEKILKKGTYIPPKVWISIDALIKMEQYVKQSDKEIGWLGLVEKTDEEYVITDVDLMKQENSEVTTDINEKGLQEYAERLIKEGRSADLEKVRCWGHSHVEMNVYPSGQDNETFREYYENCNFFIRIIANKNGSFKLDIAITEKELLFENVNWEILYPEEIANAAKEIERLRVLIEKFYKEKKETIEEIVKNEVELYVKEKPMYTYKGYGSHSYKNEDKKKSFKIKKKLKKNGNTITEYIDLENVFSDDEILYLAELCESEEELKEECMSYPEFKAYTAKDWVDLFDTIQEYFLRYGWNCENYYEERDWRG